MNEFLTDEHTETLQKLVREVVNDPSTYLGAKYLPATAVPARKIRVEVIEASGGTTQDHLPGTDPKYVQEGGNRTQEFDPGYWKETMLWGEDRILYLRELGQNDRSKRGIRQYIDRGIDRLNRRLEAKVELLRWQSIFSGGWTWMGKTLSFGIPSGNRATPIGAVWSTDGVSANNSALPLQDIRYWTTGGLANYRKYKIRKMIMNPNTARWILDNSNVRSYVQNALANPAVAQYALNDVLKFFIPGAPIAEIYDGWYQTESVDADGKITVGNAIYFIADGYIYFETALPDGDVIGEFVEGVHLAGGSIDSPGYGKFLVMEECIAPGTRGGPKNPFIEATAGVYGGPKLDRPFDVLTAYVGP